MNARTKGVVDGRLVLVLAGVFVLFVIVPLAYGTQVRGWGVPSPARRGRGGTRHLKAQEAETGSEAWGVVGMLLMVFLVIAVVWLVLALVL